MSTTTSRLGLYKPASDGSETVNVVTDLLNNLDKLDQATGVQVVTSSTRPSTPYAGKLIAESDTGYRTYFHNGTSPASGGWVEIPNSSGTYGGSLTIAGNLTVNGVGQRQFVRKTADETLTSSATYQADDHLFLPVVAGAVYKIDGFIVYQTPSAGGINLRMTGPAGTGLWTFFAVSVSGGSADAGAIRTASGSNGAGTAYQGGSGSNMTALLRGTFLPTVSGTLQFEWAQNASNATSTIVRANSWLELMRVA